MARLMRGAAARAVSGEPARAGQTVRGDELLGAPGQGNESCVQSGGVVWLRRRRTLSSCDVPSPPHEATGRRPRSTGRPFESPLCPSGGRLVGNVSSPSGGPSALLLTATEAVRHKRHLPGGPPHAFGCFSASLALEGASPEIDGSKPSFPLFLLRPAPAHAHQKRERPVH